MKTAQVFDLGRQGDGLIMHNGQKVFISGVLAGETVEYEMETENRAKLISVVKPSKDRVELLCPYAADCGGCSLQHMSARAYHEFKLRYLRELFPEFMPLPEFDEAVFVAPKTRRRVSLAVAWNGPARWVGFNPKQSDKILAVSSCAILVPELERLIAPLRAFFNDKKLDFPKRRGVGDVSLLNTSAGVDILFTLPFTPTFEWTQALTDFAIKVGAARVSWRRSEREIADPIIVPHVPVLAMGECLLRPAPGVFLQPSVEGEKALQEAVSEYVGNAKRISDLFCGAGTFALSLLKKKRVITGADNASEALQALESASEGRVKTENRDLFKTPLYPDEFEGVDAVVFDPPRAGAKAQCEQLAATEVPVIVAVSCNPASFVRDAQTLIAGGYTMTRLRPVDQFVFTPHIELVAKFEK